MIYHVINLERRKDRLEYIHKHLNDLNLPHMIHNGADLKPGWQGCKLSHLDLMKNYINGNEPFCILEDDAQFLINPTEIIERALYEIDPDWDALFLGASPQEEQQIYNEHLYRISKSYCMHAVIWNPKSKAIEYMLEHRSEIGKIDVYMSEVIFPKFNCFLTRPLICTQKQFKSDTCGRSDVSTIEKNYNFYCK